jgi:sterol desaturase/sphingolipid hydroxylase (fatty acid hydroxylase superfamily)
MSSTLQASVSTIAGILAAMAVVALIEMVIPLHARTRSNRAHVGPNLALTFITFATNVLLNGALMFVLHRLDRVGFGLLRWTGLAPWMAGVIAFVMLDLAFYVAHVAMHKVPALWRVHRVHHCDPVVDVTTTIRQHPLEGIIRYAFMATFACGLGAGLGAFMAYRTWSAINGLLEHANWRFPRWLGATLSFVSSWPNMHKVHHSRDVRESDTNYGNIFSWFDRLFGTYTPESRGETVRCGLDGFDDPRSQSTTGLLAMPFARCRASVPVIGIAPRLRPRGLHDA